MAGLTVYAVASCSTIASLVVDVQLRKRMGCCNKSIMLGRGPAPGVELRVAIQVVRRRLGDEFREPAESELSAGVTSPPVSGVRGLPFTPDDFLR